MLLFYDVSSEPLKSLESVFLSKLSFFFKGNPQDFPSNFRIFSIFKITDPSAKTSVILHIPVSFTPLTSSVDELFHVYFLCLCPTAAMLAAYTWCPHSQPVPPAAMRWIFQKHCPDRIPPRAPHLFLCACSISLSPSSAWGACGPWSLVRSHCFLKSTGSSVSTL